METLTPQENLAMEQEIQNLNEKPKNLLKDRTYLFGLACTILSAILLFTLDETSFGNRRNDFLGTVFFIHYAIAFVYFVVLFVVFRFKMFKQTEHFLLWLLTAFISCFALNRNIPVFQETTPWLIVYLTLTASGLILYAFQTFLPLIVRHLTAFLIGAGLVIYLYYTVYLFPLYPMSALAIPFFGLSLHSFVPLFMTITVGRLVWKKFIPEPILRFSFIVGMAVPLIFTVIFIVQYHQINQRVLSLYNRTQLNADADLPTWVLISQQMPDSWITEKVLKTELVYEKAPNNLDFGRIPNANFEEVRQHDPLIILSTFLTHRFEGISIEERIKILEARHDARHQAQERLWSGKDLTTANLISNIRIFPQYRLAYSEKTFQIRNHSQGSWSQQEAIYTFRLPEGSVVSSLSLWINGKESPAYLTTKSKADSAYKTIVGVQRRDPSVVHWQEGNTVSVRVFPCSPQEVRQFKIGITSPLRKDGENLVYENIYFQGPSGLGSPETVQVIFDKETKMTESPMGWESKKGKIFHEGEYRPDWQLSFKSPNLEKTPFSFAGKSYTLEEYKPDYQSFIPERIYLDINEKWTKNEFETIWEAVKSKKVYVFSETLKKLDKTNKDEIFEEAKTLKFSLFPFHHIKNPESCLVISKGVANSPNLQDLKGSVFADNLTAFLQNHSGIHLYNIGTDVSPFVKTLKEFRTFIYDDGDTEKLVNLLKNNQFLQTTKNEKAVLLDIADVKITETDLVLNQENSTAAPDHLLRLFAYNDILRQTGQDYFKQNFVRPELIAEAEKANIVSPVSSLIVLETQADYDRFDIKESKNSLKNASMKSSGAVPEPHEWLLIGLVVLVLVFLWRKQMRVSM